MKTKMTGSEYLNAVYELKQKIVAADAFWESTDLFAEDFDDRLKQYGQMNTEITTLFLELKNTEQGVNLQAELDAFAIECKEKAAKKEKAAARAVHEATFTGKKYYTCRRCSGNGKHCGGRCYGCNGAGKKKTKAFKEFLGEPTDELGMVFG